MAKEIERKFLVDPTFIESLKDGQRIKQAYIPTQDLTVVRLRVKGEKAFLTLKGQNKGMTRTEFEYEIPVDDANQMIEELCDRSIIDKTRYEVTVSDHLWEIDVFHGKNNGLVVAEIELTSEKEAFEKPIWVAQEVTSDDRYFNSNLMKNPFCEW